MFVQYNGLTTKCIIDSMDNDLLYFVPEDSVDQKTISLKEVYYAYNDFNRVFYYSWSFNENLNRIQNTTGKIYTITGDTITYIDDKGISSRSSMKKETFSCIING